MNDRSMHHHNSGDGDTWHCYGCGLTIHRADLFLGNEPPDHSCDRHDCLGVYDLRYPSRLGELIYAGDACVVNCGTYVQLMDCYSGSLVVSDNEQGYCTFKRCATENCRQAVIYPEVMCIICAYNASGGSHRLRLVPASTSPALSIASSSSGMTPPGHTVAIASCDLDHEGYAVLSSDIDDVVVIARIVATHDDGLGVFASILEGWQM